jgi:hypothetical protein
MGPLNLDGRRVAVPDLEYRRRRLAGQAVHACRERIDGGPYGIQARAVAGRLEPAGKRSHERIDHARLWLGAAVGVGLGRLCRLALGRLTGQQVSHRGRHARRARAVGRAATYPGDRLAYAD